MAGNKKAAVTILQDRDRRLLGEVAVMRIIDRELAKVVAGFGSTTRANSRLLKLTQAGLLNRFFIGSAAFGRKAVYTLSKKGGLAIGIQYRRISRVHGQTLLGDLFIEHQMHIIEIYTFFKHRQLPHGAVFKTWKTFTEPLSESTRLIPDGYSEIETPVGMRAMFVEVDLGSESMRVWEQKTRAYLSLAMSGEFTRLFGQPQFRVLVITTSPRRLNGIRATVSRHTDKIFWLTDFQTINRVGFWSPIWFRPQGNQALPLI